MGLVSNIISFIDFGLKIASGARNVRDSLHGTSADLHELELIVADVRTYNNQVKDQRHADHQLSNHERDILAMVKECDELTVELQKVIAKFKVRNGRSKTLESGRIAFRTLRNQRYIDDLRARLDGLDRRIRCNIQYMINGRNHEKWEVHELKATFKRIAGQTELDIKYCFFIDGLDEYSGDEEEVVEMLTFLSASNAIKICASTRPRSIFERYFCDTTLAFDIAKFTKADMMQHVHLQLQENENFRRLESTEPDCWKITSLIADLARGVWLWVFLVTRNLKRAVNRYEGVDMLRKIVLQFPTDLEEFFKRMVNSIQPQYLEEMAQIFLIAVDQHHPLSLYAYSLLELERQNPDYTIKAPIKELDDDYLNTKYPAWTSHIQNRCNDLLVVTIQEPQFGMAADATSVTHIVDSLHKTVRDFMRDIYYQQLTGHLKSEFLSTVSVCRMYLMLIKGMPTNIMNERRLKWEYLFLMKDLLKYAYETEKRSNHPESPLVSVLDEFDRVNAHVWGDVNYHWTRARMSACEEGCDCNFLALTVQARLIKYVRAKLKADPQKLQNKGHSLLDWALRSHRESPLRILFHYDPEDTVVDVSMVTLLLEYGADPNQPVHQDQDKTIWALFLLSIYGMQVQSPKSILAPDVPTEKWYQVCELLIEYGARQDCVLDDSKPELTMQVIFETVFGSARASALQRQMRKKAEEMQPEASNSCIVI
ncbi:hypothetical protein A1F94_005066 [Pyrenophora tritici-repentis]|nr:hypothetical protein A1F99_107780 [Pyrenophora tritici-repentis]KAG9385519.1 hypothetical protein A1F94_005066 [Pyrenophora tritici-repentis]